MAQPHTISRQIGIKTRVPNLELTPYLRGKIVAFAQAGQTLSQIQNTLGIPKSTIQSTIQRDKYRNDGRSKPRSGRPICYTAYDERRLLRLIRKEPKITYKQLKIQLGTTISNSTITRILQKYGIAKWRAAKRPLLTQEIATKRLNFALKYRHWDVQQWRKVIWSDECSIERGSGKKREFVFRTPAQKWHKEMIQTYNKSKDISIMVWGAFSGSSISDIIFLPRDFESKKQGYSAWSYIEALNDGLVPFYTPGECFMQDNAPIHTASSVKLWFEEHGIWVLSEWPPYSPDLNPIENLWYCLKNRILSEHPYLLDLPKGADQTRIAFKTAIQTEWSKIGSELCQNLINSMPRRIEAIIEAEGWHTKY